MGKSLVIVESPAKARTIGRYLGSEYAVKASMGHVRDLPRKELAVDVEGDFRPTYRIIPDKADVVEEIRRVAEDADSIFIATDPDREGEAIGWHLLQLLDGDGADVHRVLLEEITRSGVVRAFESPAAIDPNKVNAQQTRRILDRLVGYKLSPLLWDKVRRGISAGRVQSVALRLVVDREREIEAFVPEEYWSITAELEADDPPVFEATLRSRNGEKLEIGDGEQAREILSRLEGAAWKVSSVEAKTRKRRPKPPFTTSQLQQDAYARLRFSVKKTMAVAQQLYEGVDLGDQGATGLITYMRTDSTRVAPEALQEARQVVEREFGDRFASSGPRHYKSGKGAQEAHEAIRPTSAARTPESVRRHLDANQFRLYELVWRRFVASQMRDAVYDTTSVDVVAGDTTFRATGSVIRFPGFLAAYGDVKGDREEDRELPPLQEGQSLELRELTPKQHFTQPPPRFSEATLVRELERNGIGRPSTYAEILSKLRNRDYVTVESRRFVPTELGTVVVDLLVDSFERIMDVQYTARVETRLDRIESGEEDWVDALRRFWKRFSSELERAESGMRDLKREEIPTDRVCEKCGSAMVIKWGRFGRFLACTGYPECRNTKQIEVGSGAGADVDAEEIEVRVEEPEPTGEDCPKCGHPLVRRVGRFGPFVGCSNFPECRYIQPTTVGVDCPACGEGELAVKRTRRRRTFYGCSRYPDCDFATWNRPVPVDCPQCGNPYLEVRKAKGKPNRLTCPSDDCDFSTDATEVGVRSR